MTFRQFAFKNVTRNKRLYAAYFLSSMFTVMVFFTFAIFAYHPALTGDEMDSYVTQGMNISGGIIYVFSFFFILYSMSSFLQSRKKEFGLLIIQGMTIKQIRLMVFLENMLIGFFATVGGILLGLVFAKGILMVAENVLVIENKLNFYIPMEAIILSFVSFIILFFVISLFVSYVLRSKKLTELIRGDKQSKGEPKANIWLTILAVILIGGGYTVALLVRGVGVFIAMLPVIIVVSIGTYLFFTQLSVFIIRQLKKRDTFYWKKTNMILFSDLSFRMKDNARTFFMVAMVSTVAFSAIGTLYGFQTFLTEGIKLVNPNTFTYQADDSKRTEDIDFITSTIKDENMEADQEEMVLRYYPLEDKNVIIAKESDYNRFAELIGDDKIEVGEGNIRVIKFGDEGLLYTMDTDTSEVITLTSGETLKKNETIIESKALPAMYHYYVVSDRDYEKLGDPEDERYFSAWQVTQGKERVIGAAEKITEKVSPYYFTSVDLNVYEINKGYAPIMFVGLFIGIVFFVSAGSFLYFRLYTDLDTDKRKFHAISKMGLTSKELKKVLSRQTAILFFTPLIVALIHGAIALNALANMFNYNLAKESIIVLSVFSGIQIIYYVIVRFFYTKQIKQVL
ncbi:FtsX-like permease family protein [Ornithinibacillus sp. L9]|uniref:FtsX-like permease family protein n=1 Tax=Ornithinibacillus caprae TaxID=2678566 RepID=A0A6N8FHL2_9BACI|nr:ABC transporter permease [Ornithinibacillus caprae]MUK88935.1 FtsX-like permease family protein [Ornithinibacillus caprae]